MTTTTTADLMGLGLPAALAQRIGLQFTTAAGVGTAQAGATALSAGTFNRVTTAGGATAFVLPSSPQIGDDLFVENTSSTTALVFPSSGMAINAVSADGSVNVAQNVARWFIYTAANRWVSILAT
jgi:hypothetical protein